MKIQQIERLNTNGKVSQIAKVHLAAYSKSHFTAGFGVEKLEEYYERLIVASDISIVAVDDGDIVGFVIAGERVAAGVRQFTKENRFWLIGQLLKKPAIFLAKIYGLVRVRLSPRNSSLASFRVLSIAVMPNEQSRGVGVEMIKYLEEYLINKKVKIYGLSVKKGNNRAVQFYERNGFVCENEFLGSIYYIKRI